MTLFQAVYGREPPPLLRFEKGTTPVSMVEQQLVERDLILEELKTQLMRAQAVMKKRADLKRREVKYKEGDCGLFDVKALSTKIIGCPCK